MPIEPGFAMTVYKAQGATMGQVIVDLAGCSGTEAPYVIVSRATSLEGLVVLRDFDSKQIAKRRSEEVRKEFTRLTHLKCQMTAKWGSTEEGLEANRELQELQGKKATRDQKRKTTHDNNTDGKTRKTMKRPKRR